MKKAYLKDVIRFTGKNRKRFAAIIIITALGVAMFTGLYAACLDMCTQRISIFADRICLTQNPVHTGTDGG